MRIVNIIWILWASLIVGQQQGWCADGASNSPAMDLVWLKNGERLRGELIALDPQNGLSIKNPLISDTLPFALEEIVKIRMGTRPVPNGAIASNICWVRLINQDEMEAAVVSCDANTVVLDSWYAGRMTIPRGAVDSIQPIVTNPKVLYEGPSSLGEWTIGSSTAAVIASNAWTYQDGTLAANAPGSIARDLHLPEVATLDMDLAWSGYLNLSIALYADSLQPIALLSKDEAPDFGGFYSLQIRINSVQIIPVKKGAPLSGIGFAMAPGMESKTSAHLVVRTHKAERAVYVFLDGMLVLQCRDPVETLGKGTCVRFVNQDANNVAISNLRVAEWDGRMDAPTNTLNNITNDVLRLLNRELVVGDIQEIRAGKVLMQSSAATTWFSMDKIEQIHFAQNKRMTAVGSGNVQAHFNKFDVQALRRGHLTLKLEGLENGFLIASSPLFGRVKLNCAAFRTMEWQ